MAKQKKKRNKAYTGADAAVTRPVITHISAANRSKVGQWWFDRKKILKPILITGAIAIAVIVIVVELVRVFSGG
jgi:hypothetical protein